MLLFLVFTLFVGVYSAPASNGCPDGGVQSSVNSSTCYLYVNGSFMHLEDFGGNSPPDGAEDYCRKYPNGHLASISDAFTNKFITDYLQKVIVTFGADPRSLVWIGGYAYCTQVGLGADCNWNWTDADNFSYYNFENGSGYEFFDTSIAIKPSTGKWFSENGKNLYSIICEMTTN
uniref:C-type lectin domain-containing protein n=1 Tax=Acrobeloides nanus TaxID=290746 RepID=A0A914CW42_9BILA